jgi:hypothetical protein
MPRNIRGDNAVAAPGPIVHSAGEHGFAVEVIDGCTTFSPDGDMQHSRRGLMFGDPEPGPRITIAGRLHRGAAIVEETTHAQRRQGPVIELHGRLEIRYAKGHMVDHVCPPDLVSLIARFYRKPFIRVAELASRARNAAKSYAYTHCELAFVGCLNKLECPSAHAQAARRLLSTLLE